MVNFVYIEFKILAWFPVAENVDPSNVTVSEAVTPQPMYDFLANKEPSPEPMAPELLRESRETRNLKPVLKTHLLLVLHDICWTHDEDPLFPELAEKQMLQ